MSTPERHTWEPLESFESCGSPGNPGNPKIPGAPMRRATMNPGVSRNPGTAAIPRTRHPTGGML
eukprot:9405369-Alexandrium_andersonii.AAC.1